MADKIDNSPRGKIARGVRSVEKARRGRPEPALAHLVGASTKPENLKIMLNGCRSRLSQLKAVRNAAATALADETAKILARYQDEGYIISDNGAREDILGQNRRRAMIDKAVNTARKTIYSAIEEDVSGLMAKVREDERRVAAAKSAFPSMISHLMNQTLGSTERSTYMANLASAGQTGLRDAAETALHNRDLALGAAVISSIENLPKRSRDAMTISKDDIAEALVHQEFYESTDMIVVSEFILAEAQLAGREGLGRPRTATDTVALGLKRTEAEAALGRELTPDDVVWKNVVGHVEQRHSDVKLPAAAASEKAMADAKAMSERYARLSETKWGSDEWQALARELNIVDVPGEGDEA